MSNNTKNINGSRCESRTTHTERVNFADFSLSGQSPLAPVEAIESVHQGEGAAVTFHHKLPDGHWENLGAVMISELRPKWPSLAPYLARDAYFCLSSTYKQERVTRVSQVTGLPMYSRQGERLRWLNCLILDLDIYKVRPDCSFKEALEILFCELMFARLPHPSFTVASGRGIWALWLIREHTNMSTPVPAFPDKREIYKRVNRAIMRRFAHLGADPAVVDSARVMRVPGSINTLGSAQTQVVQFFKCSSNVNTLPEFGNLLGMPSCKTSFTRETAESKSEKRVHAGLNRWRIPLDGFRLLRRTRVHFIKGTRRASVYVLSYLLRRNRVREPEILNECLELAQSCKPKLGRADVKHCLSASTEAVRQDFAHSMSNATIARLLKITPEEMAALPQWFKPSREKRSERLAKRRDIISRELVLAGKWVRDRKHWLPTREMARLLAEKHDTTVSHVTVAKDYQLLFEAHFLGVRPVNSGVLMIPPLSLYQHRKLNRKEPADAALCARCRMTSAETTNIATTAVAAANRCRQGSAGCSTESA